MKRFLPTKFFYKKFLKIALPILGQQVFINSAIIIDNLMVGQLGKESIMALGAANAIVLVFMFSMFGMAHGAGIYVAQYFGAKDKENLIKAAGIKQQLMLLNGVLSVIIIWIFAPALVARFIPNIPKNIHATNQAIWYLRIFIFSQIFKCLNFGLSTTFQQIGKPTLGLKVSSVSVISNIIINYVLIFGIGPFPRMGVVGAAIGTVASKMISFLIWMIFLNTSALDSNLWKLYFQKDKILFKKIIQKTIPLLTNEIFWSIAMVIKFSIIASFGTTELAAMGIQQNIGNFVNIIWAGISGATIFLIGKKLGSGELEHAKERAFQMIGLTFKLGIIVTIVLFLLSKPILSIYNIDSEVYASSLKLIRLMALWYPLWMPIGAIFFTLRTGGKVRQIMFLDLFSSWALLLPAAFIAKSIFKWDMYQTIMFATATDFIKLLIAIYFFKQYSWLKSLVQKKATV